MQYKSYTEIAKLFNPELDYDITTSDEFRKECRDYIINYYENKNVELHVWAMVIGGSSELDMKYDIVQTTDYKDLEVLIDILDLGYNDTLFKTDEWCHKIELSSNFDYSKLDKYPHLRNIVFENPYFSLDEDWDIKLINNFNTDTFIKVFVKNVNKLDIQIDDLGFIYKNRNELSSELKNKLSEVYLNTTDPNLKIILALILDKKEKINLSEYEEDNPFHTFFTFIHGTFGTMKEILSIEDLKEYYHSFLSRSMRIYDIESLEMLQLLVDNRSNFNIGNSFVDYFRNLKYLDNLDILDNIILKDQRTVIKIFDHMAKSQGLGVDYMRNEAYNLVLRNRPTWDDFRLLFQPEPKVIV